MVGNYIPGLLLATALVAGVSFAPLTYADHSPLLRRGYGTLHHCQGNIFTVT